jgi:hypothetical protein
VSISIDKNANQYEQLVEDKTKPSKKKGLLRIGIREFQKRIKGEIVSAEVRNSADTLGLQQIYSVET